MSFCDTEPYSVPSGLAAASIVTDTSLSWRDQVGVLLQPHGPFGGGRAALGPRSP